jgi:ATP-dependent DNA ligase
MIPIKPMSAFLEGVLPARFDTLTKNDGARCIAYISNGTLELKNRRLRSITYPSYIIYI